MLRATPAVLQSLTANLTPEMWKVERSPAEWAMIELVCHLRDTEREVHAAQLKTLVDSAGTICRTAGCRGVGKAAALPGRRWSGSHP